MSASLSRGNQQNSWNDLWMAVENNQTQLVEQTLAGLTSRRKVDLLSQYSKCRDTVLHLAASCGYTDIFKLFLADLLIEDRKAVLNICCKCSSTPMQRAANNGHTEIVKYILENLEKDQQREHLKAQNKEGDTALHRAAWNGHTDTVKYLLGLLEPTEIKQLLDTQNKMGDTALHDMASNNHVETIRHTLLTVNLPHWLTLLNTKNNNCLTPFHQAIANNHSETVNFIINSLKLSSRQLIFLILHRHPRDITVNNGICCYLHTTWTGNSRTKRLLGNFYHRNSRGVRNSLMDELCELLDSKADNQGILLLDNDNNDTIFHIAAKANHYNVIQKIITCSNEKSLNSVLAKRNKNGETAYSLARCRKIKNLLSWTEIQKGFYYLKTPPKVVVIYSTANRLDADKEKSCLLKALPEFSLEPIVTQNPSEDELMEAIRSAQEDEECSGLIVVIMSHGDRGVITARDGNVPIRDILQQMNSPLLDGKPKVLLLQACQAPRPAEDIINSSSNGDPIPPSDFPRIHQHYDLPGHDFIVLAATINDGFALRNLMIPLFAENLRNSKADENMHDIFLKTKSQLVEQQPDQVPEYRTTMNKKFCLRKIFQPAAKYKSPQTRRRRIFRMLD